MIHLHTHTSRGSLLDSTVRPNELPKKAKELGMEAVACTDHGCTSALIDFYKACREEGIKPLLGCELYICEDMTKQNPESKYDHLIVLAKNKKGYKNILKLSSLGFTKGFYYKPRIDLETLARYKEGLIVTSACLGGTIPRMILESRPKDEIINVISKYKYLFEDDFYLEVQSADNPEQKEVNKNLAELSEITNTPLVASTDVHFLHKDDFELHNIFIQINQDRDNQVYKDCWFKTEDEVMEILIDDHIGFEKAMIAVANTHEIANKIEDIEIELGKSYLPTFPIPKQFKDENEYLKHKINEGIKERGIDKFPKEKRQEYIIRLKEEYKIITAKGFSGYFLIVQDIINICKQNGIYVGDGRGSADNSLVCYVLGITNVDSIKYKLNFSRFLTMERTSLPDIDMDIQSSRRHELIKLLKDKYGHHLVAQICTFGTLQAKASLDALGKVLNIPLKTIEKIKKYIPDNTSLNEAVEQSSVLQKYKQEYPKLFKYAIRLEGIERNISVHAGGIVICPSNMELTDFTGIALSKDKEEITQLEMGNVEEVGLVKMDCLGVIVLDTIADTCKLLGKDPNEFLDVSKLDFENTKTFDLLCQGKTDGVFQLESSGMKDACKRIQPRNMEELIAVISLYRPDTMSELEHYIRRKHGKEEITYIHPDMKDILCDTYGCMVYQEQIMQITKTFGGFSDGEADKFRKGIGKKIPELVKEQAQKFHNRALKNGYTKDVVEELTDTLKKMGGYSFNKGHGSGYGITSYKTAYLKANYPVEFMCSLLTHQKKDSGQTNYEKLGNYIMKCEDMGIKVANPDINLSQPEFTPHEDKILFGLNLIRGVGSNAVEEIIKNRPYNSFEEFLEKMEGNSTVTKTAIVSLIKAGAFDFTNKNREELLEYYGEWRFKHGKDSIKPIKNINKNHISKMLEARIININEAKDKELCLERWNKWRAIQHKKEWKEDVLEGNIYSWEFESLSFYLCGDPFEGYRLPSWNKYDIDEEGLFFGTVIKIKKTKVKRGRSKGKEMAFITFDTPEGQIEGTVFADKWERLWERLEKGNMVVVKAMKQEKGCIINGAMLFEDWKVKQQEKGR